MNKYTLTALCYSLLTTGSVSAMNAEFPNITEQEQDAFVRAVRKAEWSENEQRRKFVYRDRTWYMPILDWEALMDENSVLRKIVYNKDEEEGNKVRCFYKQDRIFVSSYRDAYYEVLPFRMTYIIDTQEK